MIAVEGEFLAAQLRKRPLARILEVATRVEIGLRPGEETLFAILAEAPPEPAPVVGAEELERRALERLGLDSLPEPSETDPFTRYRQRCPQVIGVAVESCRGDLQQAERLLAGWARKDSRQVVAMVEEYRARRAGPDPIRIPLKWFRWYLESRGT